MDVGTRTLISIAILLALNNAIVRLPFLMRLTWLFWAVQILDLFVAIMLFVRGIPGLHDMPAVAWMLGLLLVLHVAQNLKWVAERRREQAADAEADARASAIRAALSRTEGPTADDQ